MIEISKITDIPQYISGLTAIIFDLDDTLYSEKEYVKSGYREVAKVLSQVVNAEQKLWFAFECKKSAIDEVLISEGIYTEGLKQQCLSAYRHHLPDIHLYDGVAQMLTLLRQQGYKLGIITDGRPEGQRAKIKALALESYVDHIIVTDELGGTDYRKPNPAAYIAMKNTLGIDFRLMCYVGDNAKKDFVAPEMLGMKNIHFCNTDGLYFQE